MNKNIRIIKFILKKNVKKQGRLFIARKERANEVLRKVVRDTRFTNISIMAAFGSSIGGIFVIFTDNSPTKLDILKIENKVDKLTIMIDRVIEEFDKRGLVPDESQISVENIESNNKEREDFRVIEERQDQMAKQMKLSNIGSVVGLIVIVGILLIKPSKGLGIIEGIFRE